MNIIAIVLFQRLWTVQAEAVAGVEVSETQGDPRFAS